MTQEEITVVITKFPGIDITFSFEHSDCYVEYDQKNTYIIKINRDNQTLIKDTLKIKFVGKRQLIDQGQAHTDILWKITGLHANGVDMFPYISKIDSFYYHNFNGFGEEAKITMPLNEDIGIDGVLTIDLMLPTMAWVSILQLGLEI